MKPFEHFRSFYKDQWLPTLLWYANNHYVYSSPTAIALAKPDGDTWWIEYAAGDVEELLCHLPFWLPFIAFNAKGRYRQYATARLVNRFLRDNHPKRLSA